MSLGSRASRVWDSLPRPWASSPCRSRRQTCAVCKALVALDVTSFLGGLRVSGLGFRDLGFRVQGSGFRVQGLGFRV